ncbi:hypothetical protein [Sphingomonas sp. LHG3443-2]|uniref:hypothetical protein n=1 Tax=Sphingomonas sp. LHG3443-2 TaxID=2804639 RepID=UPI003CF42F28
MLKSAPEQGPERSGDVSRTEFLLRTAWIVIQVIAAYLLAEQVSPFFYQQF